MMDSDRVPKRFCLKRNICVVVAVLVVVVFTIIYFNRSGHIPSGTYVAEKGIEMMAVDNDNVRIVRGKSTLYSLPNMTNLKVYDKDDLAQSHPQRLFLVATNTVEWIREPVGLSPKYKVVFKCRNGR